MAQTPEYFKRYRYDRARGVTRAYSDATPVRAHLVGLLTAGASHRGIALAAEVSPTTVGRILCGHYSTCQPAVARRLLAVTPARFIARPDPEGFVPAVGTRRRIRALLALGWRHTDITAHMTAHDSAHLSAVVLHQAGDWVTRRTHDAVVHTYDTLSMRPGPSKATRARSARLGYPPPLAWDDDAIDDPTATPATPDLVDADAVDHAAITRALTGDPARPLTRPERQIAVAHLTRQGLTTDQIATRLHVTDRTILRDRQHLDPTPTRKDHAA